MSDDIEFISMDDPDFADKLRAAIGVNVGDTVEVITPQFERDDGVVPATPIGAWESLRGMSSETLKAIGCGCWDEPDADGKVLMLFPKEWYPHIPDGYEVVDIFGEVETFKRGVTDDDYRFGCLSFGIRAVLGEQR